MSRYIWLVFKDTMPVYFRSELFTSNILAIFSSKTYPCKYVSNCQIQLFMLVKILQKNEFVENVWPARSALFFYVLTHCVETVKQFDYNRYSQLTWWCSGNASALGARGPGFNPRLRQRFLCLIFVMLLLCFYFFV